MQKYKTKQTRLTGRNQYFHKVAQEFSSISFCQDKYKNLTFHFNQISKSLRYLGDTK